MDLNNEMVRELLDYCPEAGIFTWRSRDRSWFKCERDFLAWNGKHAGKRAGCDWSSPVTGFRRRHIFLFRKTWLEHSLAWMWMTNESLPAQIDHKNRDATDNRWCNLQASSNAENSRNRSRRSTSKSGVTGVDWYAKYGKWRARCTVRGKTHHLGFFEQIHDAENCVKQFRSDNGFAQGHGLSVANYRQSSTLSAQAR